MDDVDEASFVIALMKTYVDAVLCCMALTQRFDILKRLMPINFGLPIAISYPM